jgi:hypothetical protein
MLFSKGHWSVLGIETDTLEAFQNGLKNRDEMFQLSQFANDIVCKFEQKDTTGINPFDHPRLDEEGQPSTDLHILNAALKDPTPQFSDELLSRVSDKFTYGDPAFRLHHDFPVYGLWIVHNVYKDVTDVNSKKEGLAYTNVSRPFKFLNKDDKKAVEATVNGGTTVVRKQFPVIIDFEQGRVYAGTTSQDSVQALRGVIKRIGGDVHSLRWEFDGADWYERFISRLMNKSAYQAEFDTRADELTRFRADEIEKLDDKTVEKIVANYFSMTQLDSGTWVGLSVDTKVRLHKGGEPVLVTVPGDVTNMLKKVDTGNVFACQAIFQERLERTRKGVPVVYFKDAYSIELSDKNQLVDVGAVLLRNFEVRGFKRSIIREIKKSKQELTISHYWFEYARQMRNCVFEFIENVADTLELDRSKAGIIAAAEPSVEAVEEA